MSDPSLAEQAIAALDQALHERDPLSRMVLMERALKLHRQALQAAAAEHQAERNREQDKASRDKPDRPASAEKPATNNAPAQMRTADAFSCPGAYSRETT